MRYLLILSLFFSSTALADFEYLKQNDPAPYNGFIISPAKEQDLRLTDKKLTLATDLNSAYQTAITLRDKDRDILQQRLDIYQNENLRLSKEIVEARGDGFWNKFLYFALGVGATVLTVYGVKQATQ